MTELLKVAFERIDRLPAEERDRLQALAERAREEIARGDVLDNDPGTRRRG